MRQQTFLNGKATLYLVATPIGNLDEFNNRAVEILKSVAIIGCEDTRTSKVLLDKFGIKTPVASYHKFNENEAIEKYLAYLKDGKDIALISDAGYPLVSDPGEVLTKKVVESGYNVSVVSGPCAFLNALVGSGFPVSNFLFFGFLNSKRSARKKQLEKLKDLEQLLIFYEAPHRIKETLEDILSVLGNRRIVLARELTKKFEEYIRDEVKNVIEIADELKGEMVLIVEGKAAETIEVDEGTILADAKKMLKVKISKKDVVTFLCNKYKLKKNYVYSLVCKEGQNK